MRCRELDIFKILDFFEKLFGICMEFLRDFLDFKKKLGEIFGNFSGVFSWRKFLGGIFCEKFFRRIFSEDFFGGFF